MTVLSPCSVTKPRPSAKSKPLDRETLFALKYVQLGCNGTRAAKAAGYKGDRPTLAAIASENLRKPKVREILAQVRSEEIMDAIETLHAVTELARGSLEDVLDEEGHIDIKVARERGKLHLVHEYTEEEWMERTGAVDRDGRPSGAG